MEESDMSRVGSQPIKIPNGVTVMVKENLVEVQGPKGVLKREVPEPLIVEVGPEEVLVKRPDEEWRSKSLHGLTRTLVANMVMGVSEGFTKQLEIQGRGYRAAVDGNTLVLELGYSHPIRYPMPEGIQITAPSNVSIVVTGASKEAVGQTAAKIRSFRSPEPYHGKGIRYFEEYVATKEGKSKV